MPKGADLAPRWLLVAYAKHLTTATEHERAMPQGTSVFRIASLHEPEMGRIVQSGRVHAPLARQGKINEKSILAEPSLMCWPASTLRALFPQDHIHMRPDSRHIQSTVQLDVKCEVFHPGRPLADEVSSALFRAKRISGWARKTSPPKTLFWNSLQDGCCRSNDKPKFSFSFDTASPGRSEGCRRLLRGFCG